MVVLLKDHAEVDQVVNLIREGGLAHGRAKDVLIKVYCLRFYNDIRHKLEYPEFEDVFMDALHGFTERALNPECTISNVRAYFKKIYKNKLFQYLREKDRNKMALNAISNETSQESSSDSEWKKQMSEQIIRVMDQLPEHCRNLILLKYYEGKSHKEIAEILGITTESSKVELSRCKKNLLKLLKDKMK
jgi:RNA polymerase sigma-70 factor (ECF subfamily)